MSKNDSIQEKLSQQLKDMPVPPMEDAWQNMRQLLDDKDKRRRFPPLFFRGCSVMVVLLAIIVIALLMKTGKNREVNSAALHRQADAANNMNERGNNKNSNALLLPEVALHQANERTTGELHDKNLALIPAVPVKQRSLLQGRISDALRSPAATRQVFLWPSAEERFDQISLPSLVDTIHDDLLSADMKPTQVSLSPVTDSTETTGSMVILKNADSISLAVEKKSRDSSFKSKVYFSAGLAIQQQLPLNGQKSTQYNNYGRKSSLADYIPSIYLRLHHPNKWFLQAGFQYGAPQLTKELMYKTQKLDSVGSMVTREYSTLKKTYYHHIPVSFHYEILPGWHIGTGFQFSKFNGAVVQRDVIKRNVGSQPRPDTILSSKIINISAGGDSSFTQFQVHYLLESQFQWKRFSLGLRYTKGLQPFLEYTANGEIKKEKNNAMQVFLRFRLWNSGK